MNNKGLRCYLCWQFEIKNFPFVCNKKNIENTAKICDYEQEFFELILHNKFFIQIRLVRQQQQVESDVSKL